MKILLLGLILFSTLSFAKDEHEVTVQGKCDLQVIPDRGSVSFSVENQSKKQEEAVHKTHKEMNELTQKIKDLNLKNIETKTTSYTVYPVREYEKDKFIDKGTRVSMTLEVTTSDISRLGETMIIASKVGVKNIGALKTFFSLEKSRSEYLKCLDIAAEDARSKARQLGKKLDFRVGDVLRLSEVPQTPSAPQPIMFKAMAASDATAPVEAGTQQFSTTLEVTFSIK